jgi:putative ABC transport system substrate-binding protein
MKRRAFFGVLAAAPWLVAEVYGDPQDKLPRIGFLGRTVPNLSPGDELRRGLRELGYVEGKDILIEWRHTLGYEDELRPLAAELVRMKVDVIVTFGTPAARAALEATKTIPVVFTAVGEPVATGLTTSLAKPSANGTGVSLLGAETGTKRFDFLHQLSPRIRRVAYLTSLANPATAPALQAMRAAAQSVGIKLDTYNARNAGEIESVLRTIPWKSVDGVLVGGDPIFLAEAAKIAKAARAAKVPAIFPYREFHEYGVLMSYGADWRDVLHRGAYYVDKILKGAKPSDLPVEQVSKMDFIIDMRVAREMGIKVPQELLFRADQVIRW